MEIFANTADGKRSIWKVARLRLLAAGLPTKSVRLQDISALDEVTWFGIEPDRLPTGRRVAEHARRIYEANLDYPIILSRQGWVMDGMHRVCKAYLLGLQAIQAVQFEIDPEPDEEYKT